MKAVSSELIITTDDGSEGRKGFVTDALRDIIKTKKISRIIAIGPLIMMKNVAKLTSGIEGCPGSRPGSRSTDNDRRHRDVRRVPLLHLDHQMMYACVDGPDGRRPQVDFENLMKRNSRFKKEEQDSMHKYESCLARAPRGLNMAKAVNKKRTPMPTRPHVRARNFNEVHWASARRTPRPRRPAASGARSATASRVPVEVPIPEFVKAIQDGDYAAASGPS